MERPTSHDRSDAAALAAANHISPRSTLDRSNVTAVLPSLFPETLALVANEPLEIVEKRVVAVAHSVYEV